MKRICFFLFLVICVTQSATAQIPIVDAGPDQHICADSAPCVILQALVSGAPGPYLYDWQPATGLSANNIANPCARPAVTTTYYLTVTSASSSQTSAPDSVVVYVHPLPTIDAGQDREICFGDSAQLQGQAWGDTLSTHYHYQWTPSAFLNDDTLAMPITTPTTTTTYYLDAWSSFGCFGFRDSVTVFVLQGAGSVELRGGLDSIYVEVDNPNLASNAFYLWRQDGTPVNAWNHPWIIPDTGSCYYVDVALPQCRVRSDTLCAKPTSRFQGNPPLPMTVFPNPINEVATLSFFLPNAQRLTLKWVNALGQIVRKEELGWLSAGNQQQAITVPMDEESGMYWLVLTGESTHATQAVWLQQR